MEIAGTTAMRAEGHTNAARATKRGRAQESGDQMRRGTAANGNRSGGEASGGMWKMH